MLPTVSRRVCSVPTPDVFVDDILASFPGTQPLGKGGQKVVFTFDHPEFGKRVLKIGCYASPSALERIRREVGVLKELHSPYFPTHFSFELVNPNRYFITEEFLDGPTLDEAFASFDCEASACMLAHYLLLGLTVLWEKRVVHRDLKPQNIIICSDFPRIIDLGIARLLDEESLTLSAAPFGPCTRHYAAPEQLENRKRDIDQRTDQFALGIVLSQALLHGQHPFAPQVMGGDSIPQNILCNVWARDQLATSISGPMLAFLERLLGHEPYMRYRRPEDARSALAAVGGFTL
jgi:serine/threonine protein kinase